MKILAVDDDTLSLDLLEALIEQLGDHEMSKAESAVDALELVSKHQAEPFDLVLLDISMPHTDGIELCRIIRDIPEYKRTPVLMITGMSEKQHIDGAFAAGATDYLTKPFEVSELRGRIQVIESLLDQRRASTKKIFAANGLETKVEETSEFDLLEPVEISDVENVVEYHALENYVAQLSRKSLFGSSVLALRIVDFERLHRMASSIDLRFAITDVAEAISDALAPHNFLMAYAGDGSYVAVVEGGWRPDSKMLAHHVNEILVDMDLHFSDGRPLDIELYAGTSIRMISRIGARAVDALSEAQEEAERSYRDYLQDPMGKGMFWDAS